MNVRTYKKIIKRCRKKFDTDKRRRHSKMTYDEIISILTGFERNVWMIEINRQNKIANEIIHKLKAEGKW